MLRFLQRLPFMPVVALLFGWAAGTVVLAMPAWQLDALVGQIPSQWLPTALCAPLKPMGRFAYACLAALAVCALIMAPMVPLHARQRTRRQGLRVPDWPGPAFGGTDTIPIPSESLPPLERLPTFFGNASAQISAPASEEFLLDEAMALHPERDESAPARIVPSSQAAESSSPVRLPQPDPVFIQTPAPVQPPMAPRAEPLASAPPIAKAPMGHPAEAIPHLLDWIEQRLTARPTHGPLPPASLQKRAPLQEPMVRAARLI